MATEVERTIYRLEIDDSQYIQGVESLSNSTKKLSTEQSKANAKLAELQKSQKAYKQTLDETNAVLKANEKETLELTKQLNALKEAGKGSSKEANELKAQLRGLAANTKEFKIEASEIKSKLAETTNQLKLQTKEVTSLEKANTGFTSSLTKVYTGFSRIANIIPGLGIGGLIGFISGFAIKAFQEWFESINKTSGAMKLFNDVFKEAAKNSAQDIAKLDVFRDKLNDLTLSENERITVAKEYNKVADETNKIDLKNIDNLVEINKQIDKQNKLILARAVSTAALAQLTNQADDYVNKQLQFNEALRQSGLTELQAEQALASERATIAKQEDNLRKSLDQGIVKSTDIRVKSLEKEKKTEESLFVSRDVLRKLEARNIAKSNLERQEQLLAPLITAEGLSTASHDAKTGASKIINIYAQELLKIQNEVDKLTEKGFTTKESITKAIEEDFKRRSEAFDEALAKGQLTPDQVQKLNKRLAELQKLTLAQSLKSFNDQRTALLQKIDSEIAAVEEQAALKRVSNIQDSFERQRQTIVAESDKLIKTREKARDKEIAEIKKSTILTPEEIQVAIQKANAATDEFIDQVKIHTNQQLQQLSFDTFEKLSEDLQRSLKEHNIDVSRLASIDIQKQTELLKSGKISYEEYQKELTRIAKEESDRRRDNEIANLRIEINRRQAELRNNKDLTQDQQERLLEEIRSREGQIDTLERGDEVDAPIKKRVDTVQQYAQAIGAVVDSVIQFWQAANAAESAALDRSISLQEKRVDAAQRIAERGNAQYLKAEEDRLKELQIKRENAARKQLGIDAALQASQILVGITGAIAKIATPGIGIAETISSIAIIVGALATGYGLVKSLQGNQPKLAKGTKYLDRDGHPSGTDTIPIMANEGEAIIPTHKNKAYHPAVAAIYDGTIPPETLNNFVKNYHQIKSVPLPNYEGIKHAAELSMNSDGRMVVAITEQNKLIQEQNELQRATIRVLHKMGVNVSLDQNGFAVTQMEVIEQLKLRSLK